MVPSVGYLNERAKDHSLPPLFPNTTHINEDNGIKFLSEYFLAQKERNRKYPTDLRTKMCTCPRCTAYLNDATRNEATNVQNNNNPAVAREQPTTTTPNHYSPPNAACSTGSWAYSVVDNVLESSIGLVGASKGLLHANMAILLRTVSTIFESKGSRKASACFRLSKKT